MGFSKDQVDISAINKIGVVTSRYNEQVTEELEAGARAQLKEYGLADDKVIFTSVPGAYEIPLAALHLLRSGCEAVITLGCVIRGETTHYDYVCNSVERGCTKLQLKYKRPVVFGVLTTENKEQALKRAGGGKGHKGVEAVDVMMEMLSFKRTYNLD